MKKPQAQKNNGKVTDLTGLGKTPASEIRYLCKECKGKGSEQLLWPHKKTSPSSGPCYKCSVCGTVYDSSLVKLPKAAKSVSSSVAAKDTFFFETIPENRGLVQLEDEYQKYNPEPEEERLGAQGATILRSEITLTDSQGHNRTVVKRDYPSIRPVTMLD
jgi:hypothetical protein